MAFRLARSDAVGLAGVVVRCARRYRWKLVDFVAFGSMWVASWVPVVVDDIHCMLCSCFEGGLCEFAAKLVLTDRLPWAEALGGAYLLLAGAAHNGKRVLLRARSPMKHRQAGDMFWVTAPLGRPLYSLPGCGGGWVVVGVRGWHWGRSEGCERRVFAGDGCGHGLWGKDMSLPFLFTCVDIGMSCWSSTLCRTVRLRNENVLAQRA